LKIGDRPVRTFLDVSAFLVKLRNMPTPRNGQLDAGADPSELHPALSLPPLVEDGEGHRYLRVEFVRAGEPDGAAPDRSWLLVQSVPLREVALTFVWFLAALGIFVVGALAYWNRPFDRPVRLFFAMCLVSLGAFVGGFHWWVIAGSLWMNAPFAVSAVLVPAVTLHFFLIYPRSKTSLVRNPRATLGLLYSVPIAAAAGILSVLAYARWLNASHGDAAQAQHIIEALGLLRQGIYLYLTLAGGYFLLTLAALVHSFFTTRSPFEQHQVKWILWAALIATVPVTYTLYLAHFDRVGFALGRGRLPMFLASLSFLLAYAIGILRYKLMLTDVIVSKGMLYYVVSCSLTVVFSMAVALSSVVPQLLNISLSPLQLVSVLAILLPSVILLLWVRDRFQQMIDRRFFREKYQLDKALERMNRAVDHLADPSALAGMMLGSCRDVLRVDRAALYLRNLPEGPFQLVAEEGAKGIAGQIAAEPELIDALIHGGSLQRTTPGTRSEMSPVQNLLRELHAHLLHALEVGGIVGGVVVLGEKENGASYTAEDLTFLNALGQITNVALHSAKVHQDITRLNEEMRRKVERISDQTRQIAMLQAEITSVQNEQITTASTTADAEDFRRDAIKGDSPAIQRVLDTARKVAGSESSVLIRGESGTGKELLAQVLHDNSPRRNGPIIRVHCASLAPGLLESELFGHVKGSFTGAHRDKVGRFEMANGGTLFLDEIGDISLETQVKLLRVLQERRFEPVGGTQTVHADVRLITATHQPLEQLIAQGRFREDLYYRLNVISITLPPLRERREDLFELALYFLNRAAARLGKRITHINEDALAALERYDWPGNIREMENVVERAVVLAENEQITLDDLPTEIAFSLRPVPSRAVETKPPAKAPAVTSPIQPAAARVLSPPAKGRVLDTADATAERALLVDALRRCDGNKAQAARLLEMPRSTFFSKLKKYGIK
jgi:transcriptional regulator with GAF, ATPase, and Fis domain